MGATVQGNVTGADCTVLADSEERSNGLAGAAATHVCPGVAERSTRAEPERRRRQSSGAEQGGSRGYGPLGLKDSVLGS